LCSAPRPLRRSHIIPRFVYDWLKRTSATGHMRVGHTVNRRRQDGWKPRLLCADCEDRLNTWETATAQQLFVPIAEDAVERVRYGPWFAKFAVSVSWRVLTGFQLSGALTAWPPRLRTSADAALRCWREFLFDQRTNPSRFEQHAVRVGLME